MFSVGEIVICIDDSGTNLRAGGLYTCREVWVNPPTLDVYWAGQSSSPHRGFNIVVLLNECREYIDGKEAWYAASHFDKYDPPKISETVINKVKIGA